MRAINKTLFLAALLILGSCGVPKNRFRLNGKFKNIRSADIFIYSEDRFDTLHVRDGRFKFEKDIREPEIITVMYPNFSDRKIVAEPGKEAKFVTDARDLTKTRVTGTDENELLTQFYVDVTDAHGEKAERIAEDFIKKHPETLAAQAVLESWLLNGKTVDGERVKPLLSLMLKKQPHNARLSLVAGRVMPQLSTLPGMKMPAFSVKSWKDVTVDNSTFAGKYLLISFWASWQYDSFQRIRGLKNLTRPYRSKLALLNVCMDYDKRSFAITVRRDSIPEYNVCDSKAWRSPLVKTLGVTYVPGNVLVSPQGVILARDIDANALATQLRKYIKI